MSKSMEGTKTLNISPWKLKFIKFYGNVNESRRNVTILATNLINSAANKDFYVGRLIFCQYVARIMVNRFYGFSQSYSVQSINFSRAFLVLILYIAVVYIKPSPEKGKKLNRSKMSRFHRQQAQNHRAVQKTYSRKKGMHAAKRAKDKKVPFKYSIIYFCPSFFPIQNIYNATPPKRNVVLEV